MSRNGRIALATLLLTLSASPALAVTLPRLTGNFLDYFLMPFLGYLALVTIPWSFSRILRIRNSRA